MKKKNIRIKSLLLTTILLLISTFVFVTFVNFGAVFASALDSPETPVIEIPNLDEDFDDSCVLVVINQSTSKINKVFQPSYFAGCQIESVEDLTKITGDVNEKVYLNKDGFQQILKLNLIEKSKQSVLDTLHSLKDVKGLQWAGANVSFEAFSSNEIEPMSNIYRPNYYEEQWALHGTKGISAPKAWNITTGDRKVRVGIIDSGIADHADLRANLVEGWDFVNDNAITTDDPSGHGTHVAGIIGAVPAYGKSAGITGVCPNVQLIPLQVISDDGLWHAEHYTEAVNWAINNNVDILNYSGGGNKDHEPRRIAIKNYRGLFVCSSGNDGYDVDSNMHYPSDNSRDEEIGFKVISVGSIAMTGSIASSSNYGAESVSIFAPGVGIWSTVPTSIDKSGYQKRSGTSMATPAVTGVAALLYSIFLEMDYGDNYDFSYSDIASEVKKAILYSATSESNLSGKCVTGGRLNAYNAIRLVTKFKTTDLGNNEVRIDGFGYDYFGGNMVIPEKINGKTVVEIGEYAFANQSWITEVRIPYTIRKIGANAFANATALKYFTIDFLNGTYIDPENNHLEYIGNSAFNGCTTLESIEIPASVTYLGYNAFENCTELLTCNFRSESKLTAINNGTFANCIKARIFAIPDSVTAIGANAFQNCSECVMIILTAKSNLATIGNSAFEGCSELVTFDWPATLQSIGYNSFRYCSSLERVVLGSNASTVGGNAFNGCENLTIYTAKTSAPSGWVSGWNSSNRPVLYGCELQSNMPYVVSFTKSATNPSNINAVNGVKNPVRSSYSFGGWYNTADFSGTKYADIMSAPNGKLYAKWDVKDSCVAEGTLITLADGSQVAVEDLKGDEQLLVWNMFTGKFETAPILFIDSDPQREYEVINLHFSDGTSVKVISEHAFWDCDLNKYVYLRADAHKYIGHWFNKQIVSEDGTLDWTKVQLVDVVLTNEITMAWSPVTYGYLCYYVNGMLSMPGATQPLANIFDVDSETMTVDAEAFEQDIETYGLFDYDEFAEIFDVPEYIFEACGGKYLKVALGKGLTTVDELTLLIETYRKFFV